MHALRGVDLDLPAGRFTAIMGPSGSGKSTLMHCLAGLDQPTVRAAVTVAGTGLRGARRRRADRLPSRAPRLRVPVVQPAADADRRTEHPAARWSSPADRSTATGTTRWCRRSTWPTGSATVPSELSGGQQQRVAIARALIAGPDLVFADEPTGNLDSESSAEVLDHLRRSVRELGQTVVMVTHELAAAAYADDVLVIADGGIRAHLADPTVRRAGRDAAGRPMRTVLLASLRTHTRRYVAATIAVVIGVAFVVVDQRSRVGHPRRPAVAGIDQPYRGADVVVSDVTGEDAARLVDSAAERGDHAAPARLDDRSRSATATGSSTSARTSAP